MDSVLVVVGLLARFFMCWRKVWRCRVVVLMCSVGEVESVLRFAKSDVVGMVSLEVRRREGLSFGGVSPSSGVRLGVDAGIPSAAEVVGVKAEESEVVGLKAEESEVVGVKAVEAGISEGVVAGIATAGMPDEVVEKGVPEEDEEDVDEVTGFEFSDDEEPEEEEDGYIEDEEPEEEEDGYIEEEEPEEEEEDVYIEEEEPEEEEEDAYDEEEEDGYIEDEEVEEEPEEEEDAYDEEEEDDYIEDEEPEEEEDAYDEEEEDGYIEDEEVEEEPEEEEDDYIEDEEDDYIEDEEPPTPKPAPAPKPTVIPPTPKPTPKPAPAKPAKPKRKPSIEATERSVDFRTLPTEKDTLEAVQAGIRKKKHPSKRSLPSTVREYVLAHNGATIEEVRKLYPVSQIKKELNLGRIYRSGNSFGV